MCRSRSAGACAACRSIVLIKTILRPAGSRRAELINVIYFRCSGLSLSGGFMKLGGAHHTDAGFAQGICRQVCGAMLFDIILFKGRH